MKDIRYPKQFLDYQPIGGGRRRRRRRRRTRTRRRRPRRPLKRLLDGYNREVETGHLVTKRRHMKQTEVCFQSFRSKGTELHSALRNVNGHSHSKLQEWSHSA